jgi:hypothetical protein
MTFFMNMSLEIGIELRFFLFPNNNLKNNNYLIIVF